MLQWDGSVLCFGGLRRNTIESDVMLFSSDKRLRIRAAVTAVLLYAVCILAPSAAFAFATPAAAAHCLTEGVGAAHVHQERAAPHGHNHADGTSHIHADAALPDGHSDDDGKSRNGNCCGLFCVTALVQEFGSALSVPPPLSPTGPILEFGLAGRGPDRINRPPIA